MSMADLTVAVLVGGESTRFKAEKFLAKFQRKTLIAHMMNIAKSISPNVLVVTSSEEQAKSVRSVVSSAEVVVDPEESTKAPIIGALTAFEYSETSHTMLLPIDTPLANVYLLRALGDLAEGHGAVVPRWPSGYIEPLHSVYLTEHAYSKGLDLIAARRYRMQMLLDTMNRVIYVSTLVLQRFDPDLLTFRNANTPKELLRLEGQAHRRS
ncbi:MAG: molybdenum cofactor guanylyltransferase [Candidatus Thorarchaeota archaeon]|nr:molybdenum cofactor guanylyltransferase [Candidatus Thorarchaeota archaeon]